MMRVLFLISMIIFLAKKAKGRGYRYGFTAHGRRAKQGHDGHSSLFSFYKQRRGTKRQWYWWEYSEKCERGGQLYYHDYSILHYGTMFWSNIIALMHECEETGDYYNVFILSKAHKGTMTSLRCLCYFQNRIVVMIMDCETWTREHRIRHCLYTWLLTGTGQRETMFCMIMSCKIRAKR